MKIKDEYILQNIAGKWIVVNTNAGSVNFNKILSLNNSGKLLWDCLVNGAEKTDLTAALCTSFQIDEETAQKDAVTFVRELKELGCIEDEKA